MIAAQDKNQVVADTKQQIWEQIEQWLSRAHLEVGEARVVGISFRDIQLTLNVAGTKTEVILGGRYFDLKDAA